MSRSFCPVILRHMVSMQVVPNLDSTEVRLPPLGLRGTLHLPANPSGLVIFAHGSGSSRLSPRNMEVAKALNRSSLATLLFDLLTPAEEDANNRAKVFDIPLLAGRLADTVHWAEQQPGLQHLPIGLFGASTGAAAALVVAAELGETIAAVVSRGGRPDLAGSALRAVGAPTLLIVGGTDYGVIELNEAAYTELRCQKELIVIAGATHLFPEPGAMQEVIHHTARWFQQHFRARVSV